MKRMFRQLFVLAVLGCGGSVLAGQVADLSRDGIGLTIEAEPETVDVGRDFFVTVKAVSPAGKTVSLPDLRDRFRGFQLAFVAGKAAIEYMLAHDLEAETMRKGKIVEEFLASRLRLIDPSLTFRGLGLM